MANCPHCGVEVGSEDFAGMCPQCLIQGAFDSSLGVGEAKTETIATTSAQDDDFGRYQIVRPLGEGGMGTVYLAEQREPIRRMVALKVVKLGMDTNQVLARFANERQALAIMDHPNISRIFDAGATPKGRPYFVMEYVNGTTITQYCDRERLTVRARLELFLVVCNAVQHAHQKGVIHRDLKPSNVLVIKDGTRAVPKVIDFGIAKATDQWAVASTLLTEFGQMVGTPEYASPEQAEVTTGVVDQSSDVYSLGVILYELLIGTVPFEAGQMRKAGLVEMLRIIREEEAPPLSRRLTANGDAAAGIAERRQTDLASLRRLVDGDLNRIALKCLEKSRERRYGSVAELAEDVQRYLEHRPVLASSPGTVYRFRKFMRRRRTAILTTAAASAIVVLSGVTSWTVAHRESLAKPRTAQPQRVVVLGDFANTTGNTAFDGTLRQVVAREFSQSQDLRTLTDTRMAETLKFMVRPAGTKFTSEVASEICERTFSAGVVEGSIASLGSQYLAGLRARNCKTGETAAEEQVSIAKQEDVVTAFASMAKLLESRARETLPAPVKEPSLPTDATTASLEAWRSYSAALRAQEEKAHAPDIIQLLTRAVQLDPQFAMAYVYAGRLYASNGEPRLAVENIEKAFALRDRVSARENFFISFNEHREVTRNLELARQVLESWVVRFPNDLEPHGFLAAFTTQGSGQYAKASEEGEKALAIDPAYSIGYLNVAFAYIYQNRLADAEAVLRRAAEHGRENLHFSLCRYFIDFLKGDQAAMEREVTLRKQKFDSQGWFEHQEALTSAYRGRLDEADRLSQHAVTLARQAGMPELAAQFEGTRAVWSALLGSKRDAGRDAGEALKIFRGRDADYGPAFALAVVGDTTQMRGIETALAQRTQDTSVQFSYLPALRGLEALNRGDPAKALEMTQLAGPYDFAVPGTAFYTGSFFGAMYPVYVRGLAYSRMGRHHEAAGEFQKIIDRPYLTLNDPIGPMARLGLARAMVASGDRVKAASAYKELLAIWNDPTPGVAAVDAARAEAAAIR